MNCFIVPESNPELALTIQDGSNENGARLVLTMFTGNSSQLFQVFNTMILNLGSKLALEIDATNGINNGSALVQNEPNGNDNQYFLFRPDGTILNTKYNLCFSPSSHLTSGVSLVAATPTGNINQKFRIITKKF